MKSITRPLLVALLATFAVGAFASASASAARPEWEGQKNVSFTGTTGPFTFEEAGGAIYGCAGGSISGQTSGTKEVTKVLVKFVCGNNEEFCTKNGLKYNEWETHELKGRLGYLNKAQRTVGLLLEPVAGHVADCERKSIQAVDAILGSVMAPITPVGPRSNKFTLSYNQKHGIQEPLHFEGEEALHNLEIEQNFKKPLKSFGMNGTWTFTTGIYEIGILA
ncbi:MAG TPA: hypothetical protein VGG98_08685 [Solirubrobacteraceae bacterium]|jgi:hypothetical protein